MHRFVVGIDWAQTEHAICVLDPQGQVRDAFSAPHSREGLVQLVRRLARIAPAEELSIAIERPSGLLVDVLVEAGHPVVPIHPNALKASRPRYAAAGPKSDPGDAFILADLLRTDGHRFRTLRPLTTFADNSRHSSPWAAHVYAKARARGCDHPHATRILARAWLRVLWRAWTNAQPYDPARHQAAQNLEIAA